MDALTMNVKTDGYYMKEGSKPLVIIYRIYYKLMKTTLDPQSMVEPSPKGHTLILQASTSNSRLQVPNRYNGQTQPLLNNGNYKPLLPHQR